MTEIYEIDLDKLRETLELKVILEIPNFSVISEMNTSVRKCKKTGKKDFSKSAHWTQRRKRRICQNSIIRLLWSSNKLYDKIICNKPYVIILTRISPRKFDRHDNLPISFKTVTDTIADLLIPGKKRGMADSDIGLTWIYDQVKGPKGIKIEIYKK